MTIQEFLQLSAGKWLSQRTSHQLTSQESNQGNAEILVELLAGDCPELFALCQQHQVDPSLIGPGIKVVAKPLASLHAPVRQVPASTTTLMVPVLEPNQPLAGQLLWTIDQKKMTPGQFSLDGDQALTLSIASESMYIEERIWFASPNLRLRTNVQKNDAGWSLASFCSEIRMGGGQPSAASGDSSK